MESLGTVGNNSTSASISVTGDLPRQKQLRDGVPHTKGVPGTQLRVQRASQLPGGHDLTEIKLQKFKCAARYS